MATGCGEKKSSSTDDNNTFVADFMSQDNKEAVVLLSIKYNIEESVVSNIIK